MKITKSYSQGVDNASNCLSQPRRSPLVGKNPQTISQILVFSPLCLRALVSPLAVLVRPAPQKGGLRHVDALCAASRKGRGTGEPVDALWAASR
jgi:hypothetical protein